MHDVFYTLPCFKEYLFNLVLIHIALPGIVPQEVDNPSPIAIKLQDFVIQFHQILRVFDFISNLSFDQSVSLFTGINVVRCVRFEPVLNVVQKHKTFVE